MRATDNKSCSRKMARLASAGLAGASLLLAGVVATTVNLAAAQTTENPVDCGAYRIRANEAIAAKNTSRLRELARHARSSQCPQTLATIQTAISEADRAGRVPISAEETAFNRVQRSNPTCQGWRGFIEVFGASGTFGRRAAAERDRLCRGTQTGVGTGVRPLPLPPPPPVIASLDARTTPASTRAPLVRNPASLPDFALFRECEGCPEMVVIPAGSFQMGSPSGEAGRFDNEDTQAGAGGGTLRVTLRRFAISRFETTWDQWTACVNAGACNQGPVDGAGGDHGWGRGSRPIIAVDWNDAAAYAIHVGGRAGAAASYRLPTEAEWEYAARAGTSTRWSFGDTESQLGAFVWFTSNSGGRTQPVGGKAPNPWGLFDMHGNVWEWVEDCWNESYAATPQNGSANTTGGCANRAFRGGAWNGYPKILRSALRGWYTPTIRDATLGFRLSRAL